jgi:hypothetical protein
MNAARRLPSLCKHERAIAFTRDGSSDSFLCSRPSSAASTHVTRRRGRRFGWVWFVGWCEPRDEVERVARRRSGTGVVENAPRVNSAQTDRRRQPIEISTRVGREVRSRRPMPAVIDEARPAAGCLEARDTRRIGCDTRDAKRFEEPRGGRRCPGRVARLAHDVSRVEAAQQIEKPPDAPRIEGERRRKLDEKRAPLVSEAADLAKEPRQRFARSRQRSIVHRGCPSRIGRRFMRTVERRVDLGGVEARREACELRACGGEPLPVDARDIPAGRTDECAHAIDDDTHLRNRGCRMRDFVVELKQRPGELARVASMLARHHVTLKAGTALAVGTRLIARFVPSDIEAARRALDEADIRFDEGEVVPVLLESRAGELAMLSSRLADGGVTVRAIYLTSTLGNLVELAIVPDNPERAKRVLE